MPIQFRCNHCGQKLSISRKKAGSEVTCPECVHRVRVPTIEEAIAKAEKRKQEKEQVRIAAEKAAAKISASMPAFELPPPAEAPANLSQVEMQAFNIEQAEKRAKHEADYAEKLAAVEKAALEQVPEPDARNDVEIFEDDDDDSNLRLTVARPAETQQRDLSNSEAWKHHPNPWMNENEEDEDFVLAPVALEESGLDMTPMVDVTFLLLIFFMVTASFSTQKSLETSPPEPEDEGAAQSVVIEDIEEESVVVEIDEEDNIRVDDIAVSGFSELKDVLTSKMGEGKTEMLIEADVKSRHGTVVAVTDAGLEVQMQRIRRTSKKNDD